MYKIFSLIFFLTSVGLCALFLKEKNLFIFNDGSSVQRQKVEIMADDIFENIGFQYFKPDVNDSILGYHSYQIGENSLISSKAGTRIFFISKDVIADFVKPLASGSVVEIFKDDLGKDMIKAGKEDPNFMKWKEKEVNILLSKLDNANRLEVYKIANNKVVVIFNSATKLSDNAHEVFLKAKVKYLAANSASKIISKKAKVENKVNDLIKIDNYILSFDDVKISLGHTNWFDKKAPVRKFKIEKPDVELVEINITGADGKKIVSEIVGEEVHITNTPGVEFVMPAEVEVKYRALETKEIELSQIYQIAK